MNSINTHDILPTPFFSVVIPVYQAEKYLADCLDSLLIQSFPSFEILLVNDGSTDRSGEIGEVYLCKDTRIRMFHQQNSGVSAARQTGTLQARGEYILFVDADDTLPKNALEILAQNTFSYDIIIAANYPETELSGLETAALMLRAKLPTALWAKAFRRQLCTPDIFPPAYIKVGEDYLTNLQLLRQTDQVKVIHQKVYYYRIHPDSTVSRNKPDLETAKRFDRELNLILNQTQWMEKLRLPLLHQRFNALKSIILKQGKIDFSDPFVRGLLQESRHYSLNFEERCICWLKDSYLCRYVIKIYGRWRKLKYKNTSTYL